MGSAVTRRGIHSVEDSKKSVHMAPWSTLAITKKCHSKKGPHEMHQVATNRQPRPKEIVGLRLILVKEEEGAAKRGWSALRVATPTSDIDEARRILANWPNIVNDCWA